MCGILALILANPEGYACAYQLHEALYTLQHRGQDACGLATCASGGRIYQWKGNGRAEAVFKNGATLSNLPGYMGLGHLRYPTVVARTSTNSEAQPLYVNSPYGIVIVHNGNLINSSAIRQFLDLEAHRASRPPSVPNGWVLTIHKHINTQSDSELMLNIFADELNMFRKARVNSDDLIAALRKLYAKCKGAWACATMLAGYGILGFRDSHGIRPLVLGQRKATAETAAGHGMDYMLASESPALKQRGFEVVRDIAPGECVILEKGKAPLFAQIEPRKAYSPDIFEYLYFSRFDSIIDGVSVIRARKEMGYQLANTIKAELTAEELASIDVVIPVPETAVPSARCVAERLGKPSEDGFCKNRYTFRTFITSGQENRESSVKRKLAPIDIEFEGRTVLLCDDSIVRGTTSSKIVQLAIDAGAKKVYFASCAPQIIAPHIYGIDLASRGELIAYRRNNAEIAKYLGAEKVIFQTLPDLKEACMRAHTGKADGPTDFEVGVFCGKYCTPVDDGYLEHLEQLRSEIKKRKVLNDARDAVATGLADDTQRRLVDRGARFDGNEVVPNSPMPNGTDGSDYLHAKALEATALFGTSPSDRMDISLHNYGDYE